MIVCQKIGIGDIDTDHGCAEAEERFLHDPFLFEFERILTKLVVNINGV